MSVFVILMLIFILQSIWLYISELAGKDLAVDVILKFLVYVTPTLIPLILPLTILLASIMVFGSFAENYEFAAMKSTGISLQRAMRSLSVFIVFLGIVTFIFSNNVIPWANFNFYNLRKNIAKVQPAMAIAEGQFNQIGDYNIKVEEKSGDRGQYLKNVIIHQKKPQRPGNYTVIASKTGELISSEKSNILQLVLYDGNYYDEILSKEPREAVKKPHAKSTFDEYAINVDLEGLNNVDLEDKSYDNRFSMLDIKELNYTIDSLVDSKSKELKDFSTTLYNRTSISNLNENVTPEKDTLFNGDILSLFNTTTKIQLLNLAKNTASSTTQIMASKKTVAAATTKNLNKHIISLHEKYVLGLACIILFFVGAPLGALIRKGGIGLPLVIAILLFLTYHFIGIFAKNSSQDGSYSSVLGTWLSTLIMLPLSIFLTRRATKDRGLFEFDTYLDPIKKFLKIKIQKDSDPNFRTAEANAFINFDNDLLIDIIKNYRQHNYAASVKSVAYNTLLDRGISNEELLAKGIAIDSNHVDSRVTVKDGIDYSKFALVFYSIGVILLILHFVFKNNKLPEIAAASIDLSLIALGLYLFYFVFVSIKIFKFYNQTNVKLKRIHPMMMAFGFPFYMIAHFFIKNKLKEDLVISCSENIK
ncbi:lipopolysaccharide export system permease protein [Flavobacteriaceae bacterium MAR_2010_105]|nr:lipopolysaccharide export system permease protein [Flavobacteriaceae bacterium MAR_2010_105]